MKATQFLYEVLLGLALSGAYIGLGGLSIISTLSFSLSGGSSTISIIEKGRSWGVHKIPAVISILIVFSIVGFIGYLAYPSIVYNANSHQESIPITTTESIYSLNSMDGVRGSFFLVCGDVDSVTYYEFYSMSDGAYYLGKVPADGTVIYTDENQSPYLQTVVWDYYMFHPDGTQSYEGRDYSRDTQYILHVPKDTVKQTFSLGGTS